MKTVSKIPFLLVFLLLSACCPFGAYDGQKGGWQAKAAATYPRVSASSQVEMCRESAPKWCVNEKLRYCQAVSRNEVLPVLSRATGEPVSAGVIKLLNAQCEAYESEPAYFENACRGDAYGGAFTSCMQDNGFEYAYRDSRQCKSMRTW